MRSADDIAAMWKSWNILPEQHVAFYCGTGWRASEGFMYARRWAGKTSPSMTVAGTNGAATRKTRCRLASADPTVRARA
ncbi:rhodanese domain-containing protein [Enterobacter cloacae]|uniref:Rhodanese domain-containing protein n=1 Tax=Enterobacter cloacae TaxID=550 RepID=A0A377M2D7_ENTCL|nr:rhodanese domain-containing protein [Enterobacter cloacae]